LLELSPDRIALGITYYVVLLFSLSVHESAHAWTASRMGDDTALRLGRVSLNPLVHIDPIGTVLIPLLQMVSPVGIPLMGWAKPTPVDPRNFRSGWLARGQVLVAGAGPVSNLLLAFVFTAALFVAYRADVSGSLHRPVFEILRTGVLMNVALAVFNLVPLPPLDGSWIASWGLPRRIAVVYDRIVEPYGQWILLILFATGLLSLITMPFINLILGLLQRLVF
jgi:Zn-dependent protease